MAEICTMHKKATVTAVTTSWPTWCQVALGSAQSGQAGVDGPEHVHPMVGQAARPDEHRRRHHTDEGAGDPVVELLARDHYGEDPGGDGEGPAVEPAELVDDGPGPADRRRASTGQPEDGGELLDQDLDPDTGQEPVDNGQGEEVGDPAQAEQARRPPAAPRPPGPPRSPGGRSPGLPVAATAATPAANTGAMVESAPTDNRGWRPKRAKTSEPAMKA